MIILCLQVPVVGNTWISGWQIRGHYWYGRSWQLRKQGPALPPGRHWRRAQTGCHHSVEDHQVPVRLFASTAPLQLDIGPKPSHLHGSLALRGGQGTKGGAGISARWIAQNCSWRKPSSTIYPGGGLPGISKSRQRSCPWQGRSLHRAVASIVVYRKNERKFPFAFHNSRTLLTFSKCVSKLLRKIYSISTSS